MKRCYGLLVVLAGCSQGPAVPATPAAAGRGGPLQVEVAPVIEQRLDVTMRLQGELSGYQSVAVHSRVPGYVEEVLVDRGSAVKKGQTLVRLSAPDMAAHRAEAESQAEADATTYESLKAAADTPGAVAKHDLEIAQAKLASSRARVDALRALESYLVVRAPFDGMISERNVHPGALVGPPGAGPAVPLLRVEEIARLRLTVAVPEADVGAVTQGATAEFLVSAWPGEKFSGAISRVAHVIDPRTRTMPVELDVPNPASRLAPGMFADVIWPVRRAEPSLWVPATAVVQTAERTYVDQVKEGAIEIVPVRRGAAVPNRIEVFGALKKDDLVLVRGSEELRGGTKVVAQPAKVGL